MFKLKRWLALLAIGVIGGVGLMNGGSAKASVSVDPDNLNAGTVTTVEPKFHLETDIGKLKSKGAHVSFEGGKCYKAPQQSAVISPFGTEYRCEGHPKIIYSYVGTYDGRDVGAIVQITGGSNCSYVDVGTSLAAGFLLYNRAHTGHGPEIDFTITLTNANSKTSIGNIDNSWISFCSLNAYAKNKSYYKNSVYSEWFGAWGDTVYIATQNGKQNVVNFPEHSGVVARLVNGAYPIPWTDTASRKDDNFIYSGGTSKLTQGHRYALGTYNMCSTWMAPISAPIKTYVAKPTKTVDCNDSKKGWHDANGKNVQRGQRLAFMLSQKMPTMNRNILRTYNRIGFVDTIDKAFKVTDISVDNCSNGGKNAQLNSDGIGTIKARDWEAVVKKKDDGSSLVEVSMKNLGWEGFYDGRTFKVHIDTKVKSDASIGKHENTGRVDVNGYSQWTNTVNVNIIKNEYPAPVKTASVDKVNFDGKPFTYDVKQQVNNLNSDIFEKYSQMSFDDKIPDSLKVNDVQILDGDGKDVKDGAGKLSTSYNGEKNHVHFDFNKNYLDSMKMNGETYTMRISCTYVAHKLYYWEKEINNTATVNINDEPKTASVKISVPENPPKGRNQDPAFSKTTATKTFDGTKDQTVSYTLTANYGNQRLPWGSSITDNMPDNCTLDVSSIKAQYVDEMNGAKKENINVNDYFTNESTDKQLKLVMNKSKDGANKFINSQLIVTYNMKIKGNAVWSGGYKDMGMSYFNSQEDKIYVPNQATFIDSQDNGQTFVARIKISTSAKHAGLTKHANVGSFDYSKDQTVKYALNADFGNLHNPEGASIEDNLPDNCMLDRNSVKATRIASDGTTHAVNIADFFTDYSTDKKIKLVLNKGNVNEFVNSKLVVTYDMKIKGNSDWSNYYDNDTHKIRVPNSATFIDGQGGQKFTDTVSVTTDCQEPSITAYIAQDDNNFVQGDKKVHYNEHSGDSSTKAVTVAYKIVVGNYLKLRQLEVKSSVPNGFRVVSSTLRNSLTNANEGFGYQNHTNLNADNVSDNCPHIQDHGERAQSWVGKTAYWIVKTNASVANYAEYANLANNTGAFRGEMLTGAGNYGKDPRHYSNTVGAIVPNVYEYQPLASEQFANRTLKYYAKVKGLAVNAQAPTAFSKQGQPVKLNNSTVSLPDEIKTNQSQNIVASVTNASKNANVTVTNDLSNPNKAVVVTNKYCETKAVDDGIRNDFDSQPKTIAKANALYLNPYKQINYYDYDNHVIARKELNEAYVFNAKYEHPKAKGGYGIVNPNGFTVVGFSNPESENVQSKYKTIFTDKDNLADVGYLAKHGNSYTEALDFDKSVKTVDEKSIDSVLSKDKLNATDKTKNLKQDVLGYETGADGKETRHELKLSRESELHLTPQAYALHIDYKFNHRYLNNGKQLFVNADNRYSDYNSNNGSVTTGDDGGNRLYLKNWLKDGDYQTNYSLNGIGYRNRMSLNLNQPIQIYGRRYLSKTRGFNTGGEISVQPTISDSDYHVSGENADLQGWLGSY